MTQETLAVELERWLADWFNRTHFNGAAYCADQARECVVFLSDNIAALRPQPASDSELVEVMCKAGADFNGFAFPDDYSVEQADLIRACTKVELEAILPLIQSPDAAYEKAAIDGIWEQARDNHAKYSDTGSQETDIRFSALGLVGEAGEVANFVKKRWRDGDQHADDLKKECADVLAYTMLLAQALEMTAQELIDMVAFKQGVFVKKMKSRALKQGEG